MKQMTKLEKLLDHYQDELMMWELGKEKALKMGNFPVVEDYNIDRIHERINKIEELIQDEQEREKSLHKDLYQV